MSDARLYLIRHAPLVEPGRLIGRTDAAAVVPDDLQAIRARIGKVARVLASPALRCRQTAEALFPATPVEMDEDLWEQDFGTHDGAPLSDLPDLGDLSRAELAAYRWPDGESFTDVVARIRPALERATEGALPVALVAHAGTVRAALSTALEADAAGLAFEVAPLSITALGVHGGALSVAYANWQPA